MKRPFLEEICTGRERFRANFDVGRSNLAEISEIPL
jgi:hypothetical protein